MNAYTPKNSTSQYLVDQQLDMQYQQQINAEHK